MGFLKTLITGYKIMFQEFNLKHVDALPRCFSGCGTGLMMIGSAVMAKTATKEDVQQVIAEANAAVDEAKKVREGEKKAERVKRVFKAKATRGWKIVKKFRKGILMEVGGAVCNGIGLGISEKGKHKAIKAAGAIGASFAAYRANVRDDLGDEADLRYLTGRKAYKKTEKIDRKTGEVTEVLERAEDDGCAIPKNDDDFKLLFSEETCPTIWSANYDLRKANLEWVEGILTRKLLMSDTDTVLGHISLNDCRREFGGLEPSKMDVDIGGMYGMVLDPNKPKMQQHVDLHWKDDEDFVQGRKDWCWIIFPSQLIVGKIKKKNAFKKVEQ